MLIDRFEDTQSGNFYFSDPFLSPFFFVSGRCPDLWLSMSFSPAPDVFSIYLFVYLFIFIRLPLRRRRRLRRRCHRLRPERLFVSVATVCLEVGTSAVKHHRFFLEYYTAILSYLESDQN